MLSLLDTVASDYSNPPLDKTFAVCAIQGGKATVLTRPVLAADKTVAFGVVKPLYCSLFHVTGVPFDPIYAGGESEVALGTLLAAQARAASTNSNLHRIPPDLVMLYDNFSAYAADGKDKYLLLG